MYGLRIRTLTRTPGSILDSLEVIIGIDSRVLTQNLTEHRDLQLWTATLKTAMCHDPWEINVITSRGGGLLGTSSKIGFFQYFGSIYYPQRNSYCMKRVQL